jgi:inner membrane transporter RhtA
VGANALTLRVLLDAARDRILRCIRTYSQTRRATTRTACAWLCERPGHQLTPGGAAAGWIGGVASAAAYGLGGVCAALAYRDGLSPLALVTLRSATGTALVLALGLMARQFVRLPRGPALGALLIGGPLFGAQLLLYFEAVARIGAQQAVVLVHVYPLLVVLLVWLRHRTGVSLGTTVLLGAMTGGVVLVAGGASGVTAGGLVCALGSACAYACYVVFGEAWARQLPPLALSGLILAGSTVAVGAVALLIGTPMMPTARGWAIVLVLGCILIPVGLGGAFVSLRRLGPVAASLVAMLEPAVGVVAAGLVLGERLEPGQWVGAAVVVGACALLPVAVGRGGPRGREASRQVREAIASPVP